MADFSFIFKGKKFNIDVKECKTYFSKMMGLMFRKKSKPLLFIFKKKNSSAIHSFFCVDFIAVWFDNGKVVDVQLVKPWRFYIKPIGKFDRLLEIPSNSNDFRELALLIKK